MLRRVMEHDRMTRVAEKCRTRGFGAQYPAHVFDAEVIGDAISFGYVADQRFGAVDVEVVEHKVPACGGWITGNRALHMRDKVGLGACWSVGRAHHLASGDVEIDHERKRAVALVLG